MADGLKSGVEQVGSNVAIGKSNALITPYQSFDGKRVSDNAGFLATYDAAVNGFDGQDILVGNTALKSNDCRSVTVQLKSGANYIGLYGAGYDGTIRITVE